MYNTYVLFVLDRIFSGPVCSSVFIDNCKNCTFLVACQQVFCVCVCVFVCGTIIN